MNSKVNDGMRFPSIDQLVDYIDSKYLLVMGIAKRAKDLNHKSDVYKPLIENPLSKKNIGIALEEIMERKIKIVDTRFIEPIVNENVDEDIEENAEEDLDENVDLL